MLKKARAALDPKPDPAYGLPSATRAPDATRMEPEIELERFAALCAEVEAGKPLEEVLRAEALTEAAWSQSRDAWMERMSRGPEAERKTLEARYKTVFEVRQREIAQRKANAENQPEAEDAPTPPRAQPMALGLMDTVPMLPTADPEQLLARLRARRAAQAEAGTPTPPAAGVAPHQPKPPPPPPRESSPVAKMPPPPDESTPPMRPRAALVTDETAKAAAEAPAPYRPTPVAPAPVAAPKPALPFQPPASPSSNVPSSGAAPPSPQALPPPPPQAQSSGGYPRPPAPQGFPPPPPAGFGGYPAPPPPSGQAAGAPSSGASFHRPTPVPPPGNAPTPMTLAAFPAIASGPKLSLERYAAFAAEIAVNPAALGEIRSKYGLTDSGHTAETEAWQRRFAADRETYVRYATLFQHYRDWFTSRGGR